LDFGSLNLFLILTFGFNMTNRIGLGYDIHRFVEGRDLILGGVKIPFEKGLLGHSDADVLTHAICDALLGALGLGGDTHSDTCSCENSGINHL